MGAWTCAAPLSTLSPATLCSSFVSRWLTEKCCGFFQYELYMRLHLRVAKTFCDHDTEFDADEEKLVTQEDWGEALPLVLC